MSLLKGVSLFYIYSLFPYWGTFIFAGRVRGNFPSTFRVKNWAGNLRGANKGAFYPNFTEAVYRANALGVLSRLVNPKAGTSGKMGGGTLSAREGEKINSKGGPMGGV